MNTYLVLLMTIQVSLYAIVMMIFVKKRVQCVKEGIVPSSYYKTFQTEVSDYPKDLKAVERHFTNLFEMPVLFLIFGTLVLALGKVDYIILVASTIFVVFRIAHMVIHIGKNKIIPRMMTFGVSSITVVLMWFYLSVKLLLNS